MDGRLTTSATVIIGLRIIFPMTTELAARHMSPTAIMIIALFDALNPASVTSITEQTTRTLERESVNRKP